MAVIRTRFIFWLIKAYFKKWGKHFAMFFFVGLTIFFLLLRFYPVLIRYIPLEKKETIGMVGAFSTDEIPDMVISRVAKGLTQVRYDGVVVPDLATKWEIKNNGKTYVFYLKKDLKFNDGTPFTSQTIQYAFTDVEIERPDDYTIVFQLKDTYAPFLVTVSKPIFHKGYIGIGEFTINNIELNGNFIKSIQLLSTKDAFKTEKYVFYPTNEALKIAVALGEVTSAKGLYDTVIHNTDMLQFPNIQLQKKVNYSKMVTLFYNTADSLLSDKKLRNGLSYAIPNEFQLGQRIINPYPPNSYYFNETISDRKQDLTHSALLVNSSIQTGSASAKPTIIIKTLTKYLSVAETIKNDWQQIGLSVKIEEVDTIPQTFQVYLGDFNVPADPDQYTIWHSGQENNITKFKNLRIDKLLEDGRRNSNQKERVTIYYDFQKYLLDESPAAFLYFPYEYEISRK